MIFIINNKKYDTQKMRKVATVEKWYEVRSSFMSSLFGEKVGRIYSCDLLKTEKGNFLLTHTEDFGKVYAEAITEEEAKRLMLQWDYKAYEGMYGEVQEA